MPLYKTVVDCATGKAGQVVMSPEEETAFLALQAADAESAQAAQEEVATKAAARARARQLASKKWVPLTDPERDELLLKMAEFL